MGSRSLDEIFLVLVHVSLEDVFHWTQQALKGVTVDRYHPAVGNRLDACLTNCVLHQCDLSKVVSLLVLEHFLPF